MNEVELIKERYQRRSNSIPKDKYLLTNPHILMSIQERERKLVRLLKKNNLCPLIDKKILEVGCGTGSNLLDLIRLGATPANLTGNDLLESRMTTAKERLPNSVRLICSDASLLNLESNYFDIILQSTVFTSILDNDLQAKISSKMWSLLKPGGYIIWYDFIHANPFNPDVRKVSLRRVRELFPYGKFTTKKLTLFPFISEFITKQFYFPYSIFNFLPFLRMHILCFIKKD